MELVTWEHRPRLRHPLVVMAFEGWNDAGDAATLALGYLAEAWEAKRFATIEPEEFYDFTEARPQTRLVNDKTRTVEWPTVELLVATVPGSDREVVFVRGIEPQLRWQTFCRAIVGVATALGAELTLTLGALLADVPHSRPVHVSGSSDDVELAGRLGLARSDYEGPTGIIGVLQQACQDAGMPSASFWAAVPHYIHQVPSPKAALALVERSASVLGAHVDPIELREAAEEYERQVSERVAEDEDAAIYVAQLEAVDDEDASGEDGLPGALMRLDPDGLAAEVERFLRDHRRGRE